VTEVVLDDGVADCVIATGEVCTVIELKPNNSRAITKGVDQYRRYVRNLNEQLAKPGSEVIKKLIDRKSDFAKCKSFRGQVDCYKLCPEINEDNEFREIRADWKRDCS
jgi:hypothetical protein